MDTPNSRRVILFIILLSLTWNLALMFLFLCIQDDVHQRKPIQITLEDEKSQKNKKKDDNTFFVDQLVSFGTSSVNKKILLEPQNAPSSNKTGAAPQMPQQSYPADPQSPPQKDNDEDSEQHEQSLNKKDEQSEETTLEEKEEETSSEETVNEPPKTNEPKQAEENQQTIQDSLPKDTKPQPKKTQNKLADKKQTTSHSKNQQKKQLKLADITKGYMRHAKQERENTIEHSMQELPQNKQMALYVYTTKLFEILEKTAKVNQKMLYAPRNRTLDATLIVTINKDGSLIEVNLIPKIHEKEIREALLNVVNKAGLFPPIPKHLNKEKLTLSYPIKINMHQGFNTYSLGH